jgi:DNA-nicking Smr family endonuclease
MPRKVKAEEARLLRRALRDVRPRQGAAPLPEAEDDEPPPRAAAPKPKAESLKPAGKPSAKKPEPLSPDAPPALDRRTALKLSRGKMKIEGRLDLHGMSRPEAHLALIAFVEKSHAKGRRCVLVITGHGRFSPTRQSLIKRDLPLWVNQTELRGLILALVPAAADHGGAGAFYLYLARKRA